MRRAYRLSWPGRLGVSRLGVQGRSAVEPEPQRACRDPQGSSEANTVLGATFQYREQTRRCMLLSPSRLPTRAQYTAGEERAILLSDLPAGESDQRRNQCSLSVT